MTQMPLSISIRTFAFLSFLTLHPAQASAQLATEKQQKEWQKLYPKLNSKMARMEELLNYIDRFLGDDEFKNKMLKASTEFSFLAEKSSDNLPDYISKKDKKPFLKALETTHNLGKKLHKALEKNDEKAAKKLLLQLEKIRRKSHTQWAF